MYERHFGLHHRPFALLPDPGFLYFGNQHATAYGLLEYGVLQQAGFVVITGDIGTGKTTLVRYLVDHLPADVQVGLITNTHRGLGGLLSWVLDAFGIGDPAAPHVVQYRALVDWLRDNAQSGRHALLIVDEAQNLDGDGLEELRTLSNLNDAEPLLQVMLVGQPNLRSLLRRPELEQFAQRVVVDYHLQPLTREEARAYVEHRLRVAGATPDHPVFDAMALAFVHAYSRGVPRLINQLCDAALVYGYAARVPLIDAALVQEVARDRARGGILPLAAQGRAAAG
jgi:type II secretory pathway predicted ATPase ExeA